MMNSCTRNGVLRITSTYAATAARTGFGPAVRRNAQQHRDGEAERERAERQPKRQPARQ